MRMFFKRYVPPYAEGVHVAADAVTIQVALAVTRNQYRHRCLRLHNLFYVNMAMIKKTLRLCVEKGASALRKVPLR